MKVKNPAWVGVPEIVPVVAPMLIPGGLPRPRLQV